MYARSAASRSARRNSIDPVFAECALSPFIIITAATVSVNLNSGEYRVNQWISKGSSRAMTRRFAGVHFIFIPDRRRIQNSLISVATAYQPGINAQKCSKTLNSKHKKRPVSLRQHRTMRTAGFGGSFAPIVQYEKWGIHPVFPHFSYFRLCQNLAPNLLAPLCGVAINFRGGSLTLPYVWLLKSSSSVPNR